MKADSIGLYVHIPFCLKKCNYCDFCSFSALSESERNEYINRLVREINSYSRREKIKLDSIFFGGGTPSLLSVDEFSKICDAISNSFEISLDCEFTLEANPKTLTEEKLILYKARGVNRISIGMQSIHGKELKKLGRIHDFEDFKSAYKLVRASGIENVNVDIMYGIPEQTMESLNETLSALVDISPEHISAYGLIIEENTPFFNMIKTLNLPTDDAECDMYEHICSFLSAHGYSHYEISNYARPGYESRHNLKYWECREYIGVGVAAYSYFDGWRFGNSSKLCEYLSENSTEYISREKVDSESEAYEYVMLGLRLSRGISLSAYKERFSCDFLSGREEKIKEYINNGYMIVADDRLSLTEKGFYVSNTILTELL